MLKLKYPINPTKIDELFLVETPNYDEAKQRLNDPVVLSVLEAMRIMALKTTLQNTTPIESVLASTIGMSIEIGFKLGVDAAQAAALERMVCADGSNRTEALNSKTPPMAKG